ncbi:Puff-specific protein Bx42 [Orchesella cincta]|uniref:Puff-specific protein Bx42 n=1 Tax=Orchesella cincta TaxID=48709 RepID=A0A1D2MPH9_ORCCI|nr:Puff-specific protein Bx42 [Orchesella cincta]
MSSLARLLPNPSHVVRDRDDERALMRPPSTALVSLRESRAPPYGKRKGWIPRTAEDFGDGGAFPEVHVAQYPLGMGKPTTEGERKTWTLKEKFKYDVLARQGHSKDKIVYSKYTDLLPKEITTEDDPELQKPDEDNIKEITEKTRQALEKLTQSKIVAAMPVRCADKKGETQFIRYTPSQQGQAFNSGAQQRVIRMVEVQRDPMSPPRFNINSKIPRGPPSPPAPVLHSPTRKVTAKEQKEWKIPPCISNWKNSKGYTIPLDKRLAADGRGLQQVHINENFAKLAEALYIADRKAREAVEMRAQLEKKLASKEKEKKEEHLRALAQKAREERAGIRHSAATEKGDDDVKERDQLRHERHKDRQRERNIARAAPDKRNRLERERERDISEQIALGMPAKTISGGETQFDTRLFNQSRGMDSGFADDEAYTVYDKPWRQGGDVAQGIYRPKKGGDNDIYGDDLDNIIKTNKFVPDKEFSGTDRVAGSSRSGPVQFEKDEEDPFGLDQFLTQAKKASKRGADEGSKDKGSSSSSDKRRRRD